MSMIKNKSETLEQISKDIATIELSLYIDMCSQLSTMTSTLYDIRYDQSQLKAIQKMIEYKLPLNPQQYNICAFYDPLK